MSDINETPSKSEPPVPTTFGGIPVASLLTIVSGLLGNILTASPLGIAAAGAFGLIGFFIIRTIMKKINAAIDKRDDAKAASMVGEGAVDLRNQAHQINSELDNLSKVFPPKKEIK